MRRIQLAIRLWRLCVICVRGLNNVGRSACKRIQHACATPRQSRNKRNVGSCWLKTLTGFKLCGTTCNKQATTYINMRATACANGRNERCYTLHVTTFRPFARGSRASKTGNFEDETPLETENLKISIIE